MGAFMADDAFWWSELADHGIGGPVTLDMLPTADIVAEVEGEWVTYRALVIERRFVPDTGHYGTLSRTRRFMLAWRLDDPREMIWMGGGRLPGPMGPLAVENEPDEWEGYRPHIFMRLANDSAMGNRRGRADLQPVMPLGECGYPFVLPPESIARAKRIDGSPGLWLPACERWMYHVAFEAELGRRHSTSRKRVDIRMLPQQVPGFRLIAQCDGSEEARGAGCGQWIPRAEVCVPVDSTLRAEVCKPVSPPPKDTVPPPAPRQPRAP